MLDRRENPHRVDDEGPRWSNASQESFGKNPVLWLLGALGAGVLISGGRAYAYHLRDEYQWSELLVAAAMVGILAAGILVAAGLAGFVRIISGRK